VNDALKVRVAGSSGAVPRPGNACSCYLVESPQSRIILDCGPGAIQSLRRFIEPSALDAVVLSHLHPDHVFDLVLLCYLCSLPPTARAQRLNVFVHPGAIEQLRRLALAVPSSDGAKFFARSFDFHEYDPQGTIEIGDLHLTFAKTIHYVEAYAIRVACLDKAIVYSGDTAPCSAVAGLARLADLFICECSLGPDGSEGRPRGHSSAIEAAVMARDADAKHLLLTHYGEQFPRVELAAAAQHAFSGAVTIADDGLEIYV
jgi:ribonuclease BN (tRNA processing enzyme)